MPFVSRDEDGQIVALYRSPSNGVQEELAPDDPEVVQFLAAGGSSESLKWELFVSDLLMGRLIEDVIDALVERNVISFTDLPAGAQRKLIRRRTIRDRLQTPGTILSDEGGVL
jgi:hypothetical protein